MALIHANRVRVLVRALTIAGVAAALRAARDAAPAPPADPTPAARPVIVLVHGAFADATGWRHVIPLLESDGYTIVAVQNSLSSLADDIATTRRAIDAQAGPVVAVGHSYGGAVITGAASEAPNVRALVYLAAFAPDSGEPVGAFRDTYPSLLGTALVRDPAGFLTIDRTKFHGVFCADVPAGEARVLATVQKPLAAAALAESVRAAAWRTIPSWYLVSQDDRAISPDLERFYARRMGARTTEIRSSHVAFISHPQEVTQLIEEAASTHG